MSYSVRVPSVWLARLKQAPLSFCAAALALAGVIAGMVPAAEAKQPGHTYCFYGTCHRVKSLDEMRSLVGKDVVLVASHYGDCKQDRYNPCGLTSSGSRYEPQRPDNAASPIYPDGTRLLVFNPANGAAAMIRINNAGPYWGNRKLDVSTGTAKKLGFSGIASLETRIVAAPDPRESKYVKNRRYDPVAGYLGRFSSIDEAEEALAAVMAVRAMAASAIAPVSGGVIAAAQAEPVTAEARRRELAKKAAARIARLDPAMTAEPNDLLQSAIGSGAKLASVPLPVLNPQHRSRRIAGVSPPPPVMKAQAVVVAARRPLPERSPVAVAIAAAEESGNSRSQKVAASVPLPELGPARWRVLAERTPPLPEGKPTRVATVRRDIDLDDLAWHLEQVLIARHLTHTRAEAVGTMDDNPFSPERQQDDANDRVLPVSNEARAGRMG